MTKKTVLIIADYYLPGYKSGGTLRTIVNMVQRLQKYYNFKIITRDHDGPEDRVPYQNVKINAWNNLGNAEVYYLSKDNIKLNGIGKIISQTNPDCIYMNSCFSALTNNVLLLKKLNKIKNYPLIIAPEGELDKGAMSLKSFKKKNFLRLTRLLDLYKNVIWKAAGNQEIEDIKQLQKKGDEIFLAPNMPPSELFPQYRQEDKPEKNKNFVNFIFLSRFYDKKNFNWFLETSKPLTGNINIDIYAPIQDEGYWGKCKKIIAELPANFNVKYKGEIEYEKVIETLFKYHFFVLPTLGENFGHVFLEALSAGCPVLTSNRTPWENLNEKNIGWDLPLENPNLWREKIV
ncbi:MAG: glycosyltransferase, partial [Aridibacter sp.]